MSSVSKHCKFCKKDIKSSNWAKHTKTKKHMQNTGLVEKRKFPCPEDDCGYEGSSRSALYDHKKRVHRDGADEVTYYQLCKVCDLPLRSEAGATAHRLSHKHYDTIIKTRKDLTHKRIAGRVIPRLARKEIVKKVSKHKRARRYETGGKEGIYKQYMSEDFYVDCDESEYDDIIVKLIKFSTKNGLNLETEMEFNDEASNFNNDKLNNDEKIKFIWRIANAINTLLNPEEELASENMEVADDVEEGEDVEEEDEEFDQEEDQYEGD